MNGMTGTNDQAQDETRVATAALLRISEPGDGLMQALVEQMGACAVLDLITTVSSGQCSVYEATGVVEELGSGIPGVGQSASAIERWVVRAKDANGEHDIQAMDRLNARLVLPGDREWPVRLAELGAGAPLGLWVRGGGRLSELVKRSVAIVGSRAASNYGTKCASDLAWDLAAHDVTVVSGGAFGIDAAAHRAAVARECGTVAFMAGGVDRFYPAANSDLFTRIIDDGVVVSEAAPGMTPMRHRFLLRNRLIAASSLATIVIEAGWRSGALNTARHAAELSRIVAAFPGSVYSASSTGCHRLLRDHEAELVTNGNDVIELLGSDQPSFFDAAEIRGFAAPDTAVDRLSEREGICLNALSSTKPLDPGTVAGRAGLSLPETLAALAALELAGLSRRRDSGWVKVRAKSGGRT